MKLIYYTRGGTDLQMRKARWKIIFWLYGSNKFTGSYCICHLALNDYSCLSLWYGMIYSDIRLLCCIEGLFSFSPIRTWHILWFFFRLCQTQRDPLTHTLGKKCLLNTFSLQDDAPTSSSSKSSTSSKSRHRRTEKPSETTASSSLQAIQPPMQFSSSISSSQKDFDPLIRPYPDILTANNGLVLPNARSSQSPSVSGTDGDHSTSTFSSPSVKSSSSPRSKAQSKRDTHGHWSISWSNTTTRKTKCCLMAFSAPEPLNILLLQT